MRPWSAPRLSRRLWTPPGSLFTSWSLRPFWAFNLHDLIFENDDLEIGVERTLILDGVAHRGYAVGRDAGRVVFVRGGIPGEVVRVRITRRGPKGRFWYADTVEVLEASADRVAHPWPIAALVPDDDRAHPATAPVGGLDLGHVSLAGGRRWKGEVVRDQLRKIGGLTWPEVVVEAAPGDEENSGLHWRTRVQLAVDAEGRAGMRDRKSHDVITLAELPIAVPAIAELPVFDRKWPPGAKLRSEERRVGKEWRCRGAPEDDRRKGTKG